MTCRPSVRPLFRRLPRPMARICLRWFSKPPPTLVALTDLCLRDRRETDRSSFAVVLLWGKFGGLHACGATFPYIVPLPNIFLTRLSSKHRLKRKDFREILRLPWAQEASGSNPGTPTTNSLNYLRLFLRGVSITIQLGNIWEQLVGEHVHSVSLGTPTCVRINFQSCCHVRMPELSLCNFERRSALDVSLSSHGASLACAASRLKAQR